MKYSKENNSDLILLRIAGIFGPKRLPIEAAQKQTALINPLEAPLVNHIYVRDLISVALLLAKLKSPHKVWNIANGCPQLMGSLQLLVAGQTGLPAAPNESWAEAWQKASAMKKEFMSGSKRLDINRLLTHLPSFRFTSMEEAIQQSYL